MTAVPSRWLRPSEISDQLGLGDPAKVIRWIKSGQLEGVNVAESIGGRARFRVARESLAEFLRRRQVGPAPKAVRRKRRNSEEPAYY